MSLYLRPFFWCALFAGAAPLSPILAAPAGPAAPGAVPAGAAATVGTAPVAGPASPAPAPAQNAANAPTRGAANAQSQADQMGVTVAPAGGNATSGLTTGAIRPVSDEVPQPLGVEQAVAVGVARNPGLSGLAAGLAAAQATYRSLSAFPNVTLGLSTVGGTSAAPTLNGTTRDTFVDLGDTFDTSGQRRLSARGAQATYRATAAQLAESRIGLEQQIRDAYWGLVASRAQTAIAQQSLSDAQKINAATHLQQNVGVSPRIDVLRSNIDLANAGQSVVGAQGDEATALAALNALLARSPGADLHLADSLDENGTAPSSPIELPALDQMTTQALANRPAVLAAREQVRAAEFATKGARAARLPDVSVDYERSLQDPISSFVVGLNLPLFDFGSIGQSVRAARQNQKQAVAQQQQAQAQVAQQVEQGYRDLAQAQKLATSYRTDILEPSKTLLDMAQLGFQQGATGILPVLDAESTLRAARTGYITNLLNLMKAQDELLAATSTGVPTTPAPVSVMGTPPASGLSAPTMPAPTIATTPPAVVAPTP